MKVNVNKYLEEGKKLGLTPYQLTCSSTTETTVEVFNGQVETQQIGTSQDVGVKAIYDGKLGSFATDALDSRSPKMFADSVLESAKFGKEDSKDHFYKGGDKYKKADVLDKDFKPATLQEIRDFALNLCKEVSSRDNRIIQCDVSISLQETDGFKCNDLGMKCKEKAKVFVGFIQVVACQEGENRSGGWMFYSFKSLDDLYIQARKVIDKAIKSAVDFFKSGPIKSSNYKAVLSPDSVSSLLSYLMSHLNAKSIQKHLSIFEGKLNSKITSSKLTIDHKPHIRALSSSSFDADGHPTVDFNVIKNGVLNNLFYSVETALVDKVESNGCSSGNGNGSPLTLVVKGGKNSLDKLLEKMKDGLYITSISGLNSGINGQTLDFSLPCEGYLVKNGKIEKSVSMILCAGNLKALFDGVIDLADDSDYSSGIFTPSILFKKIAISGN